MTTTTEHGVSVQRSVTVKAGLEHAFSVFTDGFDTWWPRSHHIGKKALVKAVIEPRAGGRCFGREPDGNDCQWGTVTTWDPPNRLVIAWQIDPSWQFEPDMSKASEVEVRFTAEAGGMTRVDLEHRHLERHGKDFEKVRVGVGGPGGWSGLLQMFGRTANVYHPSIKPVAFILAGNDSVADRAFIAFDSPILHGFDFTPSMSIFVRCDDEQEVRSLFDQIVSQTSSGSGPPTGAALPPLTSRAGG